MKKILIIIVAISLTSIVFFVFDFSSYFNPKFIQEQLSSAGVFAPLIYMAVMALAIVISPIPTVPLDIAAGAFFGPLLGTLYSALGALCGAAVSFLIARFLGRDLIAKFLSGHLSFCKACSDKILFWFILVSRLIPVVSFDIVSYGAGLTGMSLSRFCLATFIGLLPLTFVYNYFGSIMVLGGVLPLISGGILVVLFLLIPLWMEKHDFMGVSRMINHVHQSDEHNV